MSDKLSYYGDGDPQLLPDLDTIGMDYWGDAEPINPLYQSAFVYNGNLSVVAKVNSAYVSPSYPGRLKVVITPKSSYESPSYYGRLKVIASIESRTSFMSYEGRVSVKAIPQSVCIGPPKEYVGNLKVKALCKAIYYDVDFFYLGKLNVDATIASGTEGPGTWNMQKLMRHGDWFNPSGRQPFLYSERRLT